MSDKLTITGKVKGTITRANGKVEHFEQHNTVTSKGKEHIASLLTDSAGTTDMLRMGLGTDTTPPLESQTELLGELTAWRKAFTKTQSANSLEYHSDWGPNEATQEVPPISEAGIFNALSGGDMLCRTKFNGKAKGAGDSLSLTWTITIS